MDTPLLQFTALYDECSCICDIFTKKTNKKYKYETFLGVWINPPKYS